MSVEDQTSDWIGQKPRNLRIPAANWFRISERFKLFPIRWKWRRTRMYQLMTLLLLIVFLISQVPIVSSSKLISFKSPQTNHYRNQRLQKIASELTPAESKMIFGGSRIQMELVTTMDIITPEVFHRKTRIKRSSNSPESFAEKESVEKIVQLDGLGRSFRLTLRPNPSLLNLNEFVHLFRHENYSEILSDQIVKNQLHCFYHGSASHRRRLHPHYKHHLPTHRNYAQKEEKDEIRKGRVALDICDGLKGFIIPDGTDPDHHYVIHPVPKRFRKRNAETSTALPEHFIWKKKQSVGSAHNDDELPTFHYQHQQRHRYENRQASNPSSFCGHEGGARAEPKTHRTKRSHMNFDEEPAAAFHHGGYKPRNAASDSYWLRYRSTVPPLDDFKSLGNSYNTYDPHRPIDTFGRHYSTDSYQQTMSQQTQQTHSAPDYWTPTKGVPHQQQHETQGQPTASARMDDSILGRGGGSGYQSQQFPFYTKMAASSHWTDFDERPTYNNNSSQLPSITVAPTGAHYYRQKAMIDRKGRGDNTIFGENYHSSLDSDLMATAHTILAQTKVHKEMEPAHLTIETAVFVDKDLYEHMQANFPDDTQAEVSRIVLAMVNAVQLLYQDPSLGHRVEFVLKRLEILATDPVGLLRPYDIDRFLTNFCKWQKTENPVSDADPLHWDHALILTGLDLYVVHQSGKISNQVVGLAPVAGMCTRSSSCTVNEGRHFESVYVMAHEIGHNLGMRHDGPQADNECDPTAHIMSPTLGSGKITWSPCSKRYLDMFLETSQSKCLLDKAKSENRLDHDADGRLPGERFNADQQCVLKYGRGSFHATQQPIEDVCRDLHCRKQYYTWTSHPALEGTECGLEMSCRAGKCAQKSQINEVGNSQGGGLGQVFHDRGSQMSNNQLGMDGSETAAYSTLKALDGAWGQWSPFTDCSSACLNSDQGGVTESSTGVRLAARRCDSPRPENGGRQCPGLDRRYKTCNIEKICPSTSPRTRTSQYARDVCERAAAVDTELTGSGFMSSGTNDAERACSVWCEISHGMGSRSRGWSFPDGTACKLTSRPNGSHFCIAGKCQEFTCDANSHFALSDELCNSAKTGSSSWFGNRGGTGHDGTAVAGTHRQEKAFWTKWESQSSCKLTCLAPGKGLQLVQRKCNLHVQNEADGAGNPATCSGLSLSVRLCKPDKSTILSNSCTRFQTVFEHATKLCTKYSEKVAGLSGIGMQLSPTKDDSHRPCRIGCQDVALPYRFYMVNGEEGWFPAGTDCSRGEPNKKAYCLSGKCIDFGPDDTPVYRINPKVLGRLESILRTRRDAHVVPSVVDEGSVLEFVENFAAAEREENHHDLPLEKVNAFDFSRPILFGDHEYDLSNLDGHNRQKANFWENVEGSEIEGSFYEWRKITSDCSASCGRGIQEVLVQCVSGETVVSESMCPGKKKPGKSGYVACELRRCDGTESKNRNSLWTWIQSLLPQHQTNRLTS